jgi:hypothetical protein
MGEWCELRASFDPFNGVELEGPGAELVQRELNVRRHAAEEAYETARQLREENTRLFRRFQELAEKARAEMIVLDPLSPCCAPCAGTGEVRNGAGALVECSRCEGSGKPVGGARSAP